MSIKTGIRYLLDRYLPQVSRSYRRAKAELKHRRDLRSGYTTPFGLYLYGDESLIPERQESHELDLFLHYVEQVELVIDIGANVGLFTCLVARKQKPVIAIEPHPKNLQLLYRNLTNNNLSAEVLPVAVSDAVGILPLFGGGQTASLDPTWGGVSAHMLYSHLIPTNTLDNLLADRIKGRSALIKVDVEGVEYLVLKGAQRILAENSELVWFVEHGTTESAVQEPHYLDVFEFFWNYNYQCYTIEQEQRMVTREDVEHWIALGKQAFGGKDYMFIQNPQDRAL